MVMWLGFDERVGWRKGKSVKEKKDFKCACVCANVVEYLRWVREREDNNKWQ